MVKNLELDNKILREQLSERIKFYFYIVIKILYYNKLKLNKSMLC